jgi:hypothetical protein
MSTSQRVLRLAIVVSALCSIVVATAEQVEDSAKDREAEAVRVWVAANLDEAIETLLPPPRSDEAVDLETEWVVVVRVTPASAMRKEVEVRIAKSANGRISGRVTAPVGDSIATQLARIHMSHPTFSPSQVIAAVRMQSDDISTARRAELERCARDLERVRGPYVFPNQLVLDATRYELWGLGGSQQTYATLLAGDDEPALPLLRALYRVRMLADRRGK